MIAGAIGLLLCLTLILWIWWGNTALLVSRIPLDFFPGNQRYVLAQISDLHNVRLGEENQALIRALEEAAPDGIAVTGDLVDSRRTDLETARSLLEQARKIAPVFYVTGNHEARIYDQYRELEEQLREAGVVPLHNEAVTLETGGVSWQLTGLDDPAFLQRTRPQASGETLLGEALEGLVPGNMPCVVLAHRPEYIDLYARYSVEVVLSGHAHGGQIRLPGIGGLFAPGQGFFPRYTSGLYRQGDTSLIVSRGLGNSLFPFRVNNRPELVLVELT